VRIGFVNTYSVKAGGVEHYLDRVIGDLHALGHEQALFCEYSLGRKLAQVALPEGVKRFAVDEMGREAAVSAFFAWNPEIVYAHGLDDPALEERLIGRVPSVYFPHNYNETCISSSKAHSFPLRRPCERTFGPACLALYFPRRCGGSDPRVMIRDYRKRQRKLRVLPRYDALITHSEHLRREYVRHGVPDERTRTIPYTSTLPAHGDMGAARARAASFRAAFAARESRDASAATLRILLVTRMQPLKGGDLLLAALPAVAAGLRMNVHAVLAGDGFARPRWEAEGRRVAAADPRVKVEFSGWLDEAAVRRQMADSHLLAFPSVWPEPYGLSGVEALGHGLPVIGYRVGGVPEWLRDGENGCLAPGDPPTVDGLVAAILRATHDPEVFASLCEGAVRSMDGRVPELHTRELISFFESVLAGQKAGVAP
jgi:glycosyltransferase involved in cell wall biosynthesis